MIVRSDRLPLPGETVLGKDLVTAPGGKGANQAVAAARLDAHVTFIAKVGKDMFGQQALDNFRREGLDSRFTFQDAEAPSGVALIVVGPGGQNIIAVAPGANNRLTPADIESAGQAFDGAKVVVLQLETPIETVMAAAKAGRAAGAKVILNPAPAQVLPEELYKQVDIITPNETEATLLTGDQSPEAAALAILGRGVRLVIITLGKDGALVASAEDMKRVPGFSVQAVDATAAGDAFNGALAVALAREKSLSEAVRFSHAVAALSVTKLGAQPSLPTAQETEDFLGRL
jgi:ribokinase